MKATASSTCVTTSDPNLSPQLAIQVDSAHFFVSTIQLNPWLSLELKSVIHIFRVRLEMREEKMEIMYNYLLTSIGQGSTIYQCL